VLHSRHRLDGHYVHVNGISVIMTAGTSTRDGPGRRIAAWRKTLGWSQQRLADTVGVSRGYLGDVEAGRSEPSGALLTALTSATDVSADWLLTGEGEMLRRPAGAVRDEPAARYQVEAESDASWERRIAMLSALLADLSPEHREAILADALSRAATAQQLAELGQALADIRESLRSGTA
jgi:transcriptional regulator with XRE-family HTH domain